MSDCYKKMYLNWKWRGSLVDGHLNSVEMASVAANQKQTVN